MKQKARPPGPHPYDKAREDLKAAGGGVFGISMNTPIRRGWGSGLQPWVGDELVSFEISAPRGILGLRHHNVDFRTPVTQSGWFVNIPAPQDADELARLATVFMDLINTQRRVE